MPKENVGHGTTPAIYTLLFSYINCVGIIFLNVLYVSYSRKYIYSLLQYKLAKTRLVHAFDKFQPSYY